jgi:hypothetical protein
MRVWQRIGYFTTLVGVLAGIGIGFSPNKAPAEGEPGKTLSYPQRILIIRHAEKTGDKADIHLSKEGKERAEALDQLFVASKDRLHPFPKPDFIFAATAHMDSQRPVETVTPLARKLKLPIIDKYDSKSPTAKSDDKEKKPKKEGMLELRDELFGSPKYAGKTILIAWRHRTIGELARTLKAAKAPATWEDKVFDRVWEIVYDDAGNATFHDRPQRLLPGDAEK